VLEEERVSGEEDGRKKERKRNAQRDKLHYGLEEIEAFVVVEGRVGEFLEHAEDALQLLWIRSNLRACLAHVRLKEANESRHGALELVPRQRIQQHGEDLGVKGGNLRRTKLEAESEQLEHLEEKKER
jgi:hypothetical protein